MKDLIVRQKLIPFEKAIGEIAAEPVIPLSTGDSSNFKRRNRYTGALYSNQPAYRARGENPATGRRHTYIYEQPEGEADVSGYFITFEGVEGAGKTSVLQALTNTLTEMGYEVLTTREPGGIDIAEQIRNIILDPVNTKMEERTEALLYAQPADNILWKKFSQHYSKEKSFFAIVLLTLALLTKGMHGVLESKRFMKSINLPSKISCQT